MRRLLLLLLVAALPAFAIAQGSFAIEANVIAGRVAKHTPKFRPPVPDLSTAVELAFVRQTTGTKDWEQRRGFPVWGYNALVTRYGIDSIYGTAFSIGPFLQIPLIRGKRFEWTLRGGLGIGYVTRHYERAPRWDTINNAMGGSVNNFSTFSTDLRYRINMYWSLQAGANFSHMSNGAIKQPNLGVNMYGAHIGVRYWPAGDRPPLLERERPRLRNRILGQARFGLAFNESGNTDGPIYVTYLGSAWLSRRYRSKNKVFIGADYSYHPRIYAFLRNNEINIGSERANSWKSAIFIGHEWMFGRLALTAQVGVYLKQAALKQDAYYQKIGYNYYLIRNERGALKEVFLSCQLKTHKSIAELVEFGLGVGF